MYHTTILSGGSLRDSQHTFTLIVFEYYKSEHRGQYAFMKHLPLLHLSRASVLLSKIMPSGATPITLHGPCRRDMVVIATFAPRNILGVC